MFGNLFSVNRIHRFRNLWVESTSSSCDSQWHTVLPGVHCTTRGHSKGAPKPAAITSICSLWTLHAMNKKKRYRTGWINWSSLHEVVRLLLCIDAGKFTQDSVTFAASVPGDNMDQSVTKKTSPTRTRSDGDNGLIHSNMQSTLDYLDAIPWRWGKYTLGEGRERWWISFTA